MDHGLSAESKARRRTLLEVNGPEVLAGMEESGFADPVGMIIDMGDDHGLEMARAALANQGMSPDEIERAVASVSGPNMIPTLKVVLQFESAREVLGTTSLTAKQNLDAPRPPGMHFVVAVSGGGNSYMQVSMAS